MKHDSGQVTGVLLSIPRHQQCNLSVVFSNVAGSSDPLILTLSKTTNELMYYD